MIRRRTILAILLALLQLVGSFRPTLTIHKHKSSLFTSRLVRTQPQHGQKHSRLFVNDDDESNKTKESTTLLEKLDEFGMGLKPKALKYKEKSAASGLETSKKYLYKLQSSLLFVLFIFYRAYRGFFVILPAVFRETYRKMQQAVESPFNDDDDNNDDIIRQDINPETGKVRFRTVFTITILSAILTMSYVIGGALRVIGKFFKTITSTSSMSKSFEAAADEVMTNEDKILRFTKKDGKGINGSNNVDGGGGGDLKP
jgi:hypothetical protein